MISKIEKGKRKYLSGLFVADAISPMAKLKNNKISNQTTYIVSLLLDYYLI